MPLVLGSRSTYVRGGFGGFKGRQLKAGDVLEAYNSDMPLRFVVSTPLELIPTYGKELKVEVVLGPQSDLFTDKGVKTLLLSKYIVTTESDRMGYRLDGHDVEQKNLLDVISDATPVGAVQVARSGKPIIVMRDAQTTGGYPKIAVVTTPDVSRLGQVKPNNIILFSGISVREARVKLLEYKKTLSQLESRLIELHQ